jgi:hypothetical protein
MELGVDYYFNEQGLVVFTKAYHQKRGFCCKNKCKHCPWNYRKNVEKMQSQAQKDSSTPDCSAEEHPK